MSLIINNSPNIGKTPIQPGVDRNTLFLPLLVSWHDPSYIEGTAASIGVRSNSVFTIHSSIPVNPEWTLYATWREEVADSIGVGSEGTITSGSFDTSVYSVALAIDSEGVLTAPGGVAEAVTRLAIRSLADFYSEGAGAAWVSWSKIGHLDFTIGKDNVAGKRPLDWAGDIYKIKKLTDKVVVYGAGGVSILKPASNTYGLITVHKTGLIGKQAICGTDSEHYFIDLRGKMYKLGEGIELLDYREYLSALGANTVMSYDYENSLIHICDNTIGFIYSTLSKSLTQGPANITGVGQDGDDSLVTADGSVTSTPFSICTDVYDLGSRKPKTIFSIEVGTDTTIDLWAAIDFRINRQDAFKTTPWVRVNPDGLAPLPCFGTEFRFRLKKVSYAAFEIDYVKINGVIHRYSYLDAYGGKADI